jgi:hypothetical protein
LETLETKNPRTARGTRGRLNLHFLGMFGDVLVTGLNKAKLEGWLNSLVFKGHAKRFEGARTPQTAPCRWSRRYNCAAVKSAGSHSGSGPISGKRFKIRTRVTPQSRGRSFVSRLCRSAVYGLGFCVYEGHPLGRCWLPSCGVLQLRQPPTNLEKALPRISSER